ncbi:MAG: RDD family protein [Microbacteriaceae bacterium]
MPDTTDATSSWPGKRLGLPETGPRSIAQFGRRLVGVIIDWTIATAIAYAFFGGDRFAIIIAFVGVQVVFLIAFAGTPGHLMLGMRVVPLKPVWIGIHRPIIRTVLLSFVLPAVIWDADERGFHDKLAGTVLVRR